MKIFDWLGKHIGNVKTTVEPDGMDLPPTRQEWVPEIDVMTLVDPQGHYLYAKDIISGRLTVNQARYLAGYTPYVKEEQNV